MKKKKKDYNKLNITNSEVKIEDTMIDKDAENPENVCKNIVLDENVTNELNISAVSDAALDAEDISSEFENTESFNVSMDADVDAQVKNLLTKSRNAEGQVVYRCTECNRSSKHGGNLRKHIEIHLEGLSYPCKVCERIFKTRNTLQSHMYGHKEEI